MFLHRNAGAEGLSPPTRGSHHELDLRADREGSIPAHAGKPCAVTAGGSPNTVYPRPRGEARVRHSSPRFVLGLSPPTRGSQAELTAAGLWDRSIPAHAGKPINVVHIVRTQRVYPRPRGEAISIRHLSSPLEGLSPPTRGSHRYQDHGHAAHGSIPAHAGKPVTNVGRVRSVRVYPRPRGEAAATFPIWSLFEGLSPPTRGSLAAHHRRPAPDRSIPAHAGKPLVLAAKSEFYKVYPRPRGEARTAESFANQAKGLSPPTRGSPSYPQTSSSKCGSIPAHAGKPRDWRVRVFQWEVYPRPRGEALLRSASRTPLRGLSPPTRGSRVRTGLGARNGGSIPAHAGKPVSSSRPDAPRQVYPRPRGEAPDERYLVVDHEGLSPPTRGSRTRGHCDLRRWRSIPAHAGKPEPPAVMGGGETVYPRPRGEANARASPHPLPPGLSPPTRGSPPFSFLSIYSIRSIPAHAGKPP